MNNKIITLLMLSVFLISSATVMTADESEASDTITITEIGVTNPATLTFDGPVSHIVCFGSSYAATAVDLGVLDKVVLFSTYSTYKYTGLEEIKAIEEKNSDMFISSSSSNSANILSKLAELETEGKFVKSTDVIVGTSNSSTLGAILVDAGYKCLGYYPKTYEQNIQIVRDLGKLFGSENYESIASTMGSAPTEISNKLSDVNITDSNRIRAVSVSQSKIQSTGSMGGTLIELAGGINVGAGLAPSGTTSFAADQTFFAQNDIDVIFYNSNNGVSSETFASKMGIGSDVKFVEMGLLWVSYGTGVGEGLWGYAAGMYPDYFDASSVITTYPSDNDNTALYASIGIVALAIAAIVIIYVVKFRQ